MQLWDTTGHPVTGSPGSIRLPTKLPHPSAAERKTQTLNLTHHQELFLLRHLTGSVSSLHLISPQPAPCLNYIHLLRTSRGTLQISWVTPVTQIKDTHSTAAPPVSWQTPPHCTPGTLTTSIFVSRSAYSTSHFLSLRAGSASQHPSPVYDRTLSLVCFVKGGCSLLCQY